MCERIFANKHKREFIRTDLRKLIQPVVVNALKTESYILLAKNFNLVH